MSGPSTDRTIPAYAPWNKGTTAYDRGFAQGYSAGLAQRPWERLRRLVPVALILGTLLVLWEGAFGRRGSGLLRDLLRGPAMCVLFLTLWAVLVLSPLWLLLGLVVLWNGHAQRRRLLQRPTESSQEPF